MALTEAQKKNLSDLAVGKTVTIQISYDNQIAALRKQVTVLSEASKVPLVDEMVVLEDVVANAKKPKDDKPKAKATAKKIKS